MTPEVTTIIPTHDRRSMLRAALASVLWQRDVEIEVMVVDDGSTDGTADFLESVRDPGISVIRNDAPRGVSAARNCGVEHARGYWVAFVDDDDVWAPDKLRRQLDAATSSGAQWGYAGAVNINLDLAIVGGRPPPGPTEVMSTIGRYNNVPGGGSNVIVRRQLMEDVGSFDERLYNTEDWEMWIRLAEMGIPACTDSPLVGYRVHDTNASLDWRRIIEGLALIEARHGTRTDKGVIYRWLAESSLRRGSRAQALSLMAKASLKGETVGVLQDITWIFRRRFGWYPRARGPEQQARSEYREQARTWLRELRGRLDSFPQ